LAGWEATLVNFQGWESRNGGLPQDLRPPARSARGMSMSGPCLTLDDQTAFQLRISRASVSPRLVKKDPRRNCTNFLGGVPQYQSSSRFRLHKSLPSASARRPDMSRTTSSWYPGRPDFRSIEDIRSPHIPSFIIR
jgi:hypothetical protein